MSKPFHILKHEHRIIERSLRALDGVCVRLEGGNMVPSGALGEVVDFITTFADLYHHGKEEKFLFPALERRGISREGGPLGVMEYEHQVERELIGELRHAAALYQDGEPEAAQQFVEAARPYLRLLVEHIHKEDNVLFRIGDELLEDEERTALAESFKQVDAVLGGQTLTDFEKLASALEDKWAV